MYYKTFNLFKMEGIKKIDNPSIHTYPYIGVINKDSVINLFIYLNEDTTIDRQFIKKNKYFFEKKTSYDKEDNSLVIQDCFYGLEKIIIMEYINEGYDSTFLLNASLQNKNSRITFTFHANEAKFKIENVSDFLDSLIIGNSPYLKIVSSIRKESFERKEKELIINSTVCFDDQIDCLYSNRKFSLKTYDEFYIPYFYKQMKLN